MCGARPDLDLVATFDASGFRLTVASAGHDVLLGQSDLGHCESDRLEVVGRNRLVAVRADRDPLVALRGSLGEHAPDAAGRPPPQEHENESAAVVEVLESEETVNSPLDPSAGDSIDARAERKLATERGVHPGSQTRFAVQPTMMTTYPELPAAGYTRFLPSPSSSSTSMQRLPFAAPAAAACAALLSFSPSTDAQDLGNPGERVPADAITHAVVESMATVIEREKTWVHTPQIQRVWNGQDGAWFIAPDTARTPAFSGTRAAINKWGDPRVGIGFPVATDVEGVEVAGHTAVFAPGLVVVGYRDGVEVARSDRFAVSPSYGRLTLDFENVDRIVFEAEQQNGLRSYFAIDDLSFHPHAEIGGTSTVIDFDDLDAGTDLTGSDYRGLEWEQGTGLRDRDPAGEIHAPKNPTLDNGIGTDTGDVFHAASNTASPINVWQEIDGSRLGDPGANLIPPDTCGAVGPNNFIAITNSNLSVYRRSDGARTVNVSLGAFWNFNQLIGDPRAAWDHHANRWIVLATSFNRTSEIFLAVSTSPDPNGNWFKFQFRVDQGSDSGRWPDFPTLGFDARGIYTAAYQVASPARMTIWAIDKAPMLSGRPVVGTITAFRGLPWEGAIQPCATYGDPGFEYLVSRRANDELRIRRIVPPLTAPTLFEHRIVSVPRHGDAPNAPALGSNTPLATIDTRPWNAVYRNGAVWTTQSVAIGNKAGVRWYELNVNTGVADQVGSITDPVWHYLFPSIAVDANGDVCLGFSGSHAGVYASTFVTGRQAGDPAGTTRAPVLTKAGTGPWNRTDSGGRNRFGDYSLTSCDPIDDTGFWTIQEYIPSNNVWQTYIVRAGFEVCNYGTGLAGTNGVPTISGGNLPTLGNVFDLRIDSSAPTASSGALIIGLGRANIPLLGGTVLVQSTIADTIPIAASGTTTNIPIPVPNAPSAVGVPVMFQAAIADAGAVQGVSFTDGLEISPRTR